MFHVSPRRRPRPRPRRRPRSPQAGPARRGGLVLAALGALLVLAACQSGAGTPPSDAWTAADLADVFDLGELGGSLANAPDGDGLLLDGKRLPREVLAAFPHLTMGRSLNLLRLDDDALRAMAPAAAEFLLRAAPGELRANLARYGLDATAVRTAWNDRGALDLAGLRAAATRLDATGRGVAGAGVGAGTRLLADLGITEARR